MPLRGEAGFVAAALVAAALVSGCQSSPGGNSNAPADGAGAAKSATPVKANEDGTIPSGTGVEREKPSAGKGNVQGKVFYNEKPAAGIEVRLCQTFNRFIGGCSGETFTARTDDTGEYVIKDVQPGVYEALTAQVFDTPYYVFATSGIMSAAKYEIGEGKTFFAPDTHLFKQDLKLVGPKAGAKVAAENVEIKWEPYPDAAYYKFSVHADTASGAKTEYDFINKRVDGTSYTLEKPLSPGSYSAKVEAYNGNDRKLSQSADDIKFTVTGAPAGGK